MFKFHFKYSICFFFAHSDSTRRHLSTVTSQRARHKRIGRGALLATFIALFFSVTLKTDAQDLDTSQTYEIQGKSSGRVLDVYGSLTADGTPTDIANFLNTPNQKWQLESVGSDTYRVISD